MSEHFERRANSTGLRVVLFAQSGVLGGAELSLLELANQLTYDYGARCVVVLPEQGPLREKLNEMNLPFISISSMAWWAFPKAWAMSRSQMCDTIKNGVSICFSEILPQVRQFDPDVIFTQSTVLPWGAITAELLNKPHVWSVCEYGDRDYDLQSPYTLQQLFRWVDEYSTHLIFCSNALAQAHFNDVSQSKKTVAYRFVRLPDTNREGEARYPKEVGRVRLGVIGRLTAGKGQEDAVQALAELRHRAYDVELFMIGENRTPYGKLIDQLASELNVSDRMVLPGFIENPFALIKSCDIVLVTSRSEAFGRVVVESMLLERPVVYARAGGMVEYMKDGVTGLSYVPGNVSDLTDRIERLIVDTDFACRLGATAKDFAQRTFTKDGFSGPIFRQLLRATNGYQKRLTASQPKLSETLMQGVNNVFSKL